jgi:hypothetical protein
MICAICPQIAVVLGGLSFTLARHKVVGLAQLSHLLPGAQQALELHKYSDCKLILCSSQWNPRAKLADPRHRNTVTCYSFHELVRIQLKSLMAFEVSVKEARPVRKMCIQTLQAH